MNLKKLLSIKSTLKVEAEEVSAYFVDDRTHDRRLHFRRKFDPFFASSATTVVRSGDNPIKEILSQQDLKLLDSALSLGHYNSYLK